MTNKIDSVTINKSVEFINTYKCQKCGHETSTETITIKFNDPELDGLYCMKCWGRSIIETCGKLKEI